MKKFFSVLLVFLFITSSILIQGCATDKPFVRKDFSTLSPIKVVRYETPGIERSTKTETLLITTAAIILPGGSALFLLNDKYAEGKGKKMQKQIPDFGELVMNKLVDKLKNEVPDFPDLIVECNPVDEDYIDNEKSTIISIKVKRVAYGFLDFLRGGGNGFYSKTIVTMKDPHGDILWRKKFTYLSKDFDRAKEIDEFEADNAKLLREEIEFAAEQTVINLINHLKGETPEKENNQEKNL